MNIALKKVIDLYGSQNKLAQHLGCDLRQQHINYWLHHRIPAEWVLAIERASKGLVSRYDLRPDIYGSPNNEFNKKTIKF